MGSEEVLNGPMTVLSMVNGMIGGLILILPLLALEAGYILTLIILIVTGSFSYYSCYLCVIHMGDQPDLDFAILKHFNGNKYIKIFYDLCVWSNLILIDMLYFELITIQWIGLIPPHDHYSIINPLVNAVVLIGIVFVMKHFQFGATLMAYGIISIITYLLFLIWVAATGDYSSPPVTDYKSFGSGAVQLAAAMGGAYSIQSFFIPVLKKNPKSHKYIFYTLLAYILGESAYLYIAYLGSFGIWHRKYIGSESSQTIEGYFNTGTWQVMIIEAIYLIHLYSVFPEFLLISKKRMFGVLNLQESGKGKITIPQIIYIALFVGVCLTVTMVHVNIDNIIDINGAVIGFFFIYFIPAMLHFKCMYFSKGKRPMPQEQFQSEGTVVQQKEAERQSIKPATQDIQIGESQHKPSMLETPQQKEKGNQNQNNLQRHLLESRQSSLPIKIQISHKQFQNSFYYCGCQNEKYPTWKKVVDFTFMSVMMLFGAFIMVNGIIGVARGG